MEYYNLQFNEHEIDLILACLQTVINLNDDTLDIDFSDVEEVQSQIYHQLEEPDEYED